VSFRVIDIQLSADDRKSMAIGNQALGRLRVARKEQIIARSYPGLASWALDSFIQYGLHRIVALGTGMTAEWNRKRFLNCIVLARSLMETVASWFRVLDHTYKLLPAEDIRRIHSTLMVALFGRRDLAPGDDSFPPAINALTSIDRLDRAYPKTRAMYDIICEFVHPNCDGFLLFGKPDLQTGNAQLGEHLSSERLGAVSTAMAGAHFLGIADSFLEKYETLFRPQVEALDRKFGEKVEAWPGTPSDMWMPKP
jgi:hypothetical protein